MLNIDPAVYVSHAVFLTERDKLFATSWQLLGPVSKLAERRSYLATEIAGLKVFAVRSNDGQLRAFLLNLLSEFPVGSKSLLVLSDWLAEMLGAENRPHLVRAQNLLARTGN